MSFESASSCPVVGRGQPLRRHAQQVLRQQPQVDHAAPPPAIALPAPGRRHGRHGRPERRAHAGRTAAPGSRPPSAARREAAQRLERRAPEEHRLVAVRQAGTAARAAARPISIRRACHAGAVQPKPEAAPLIRRRGGRAGHLVPPAVAQPGVGMQRPPPTSAVARVEPGRQLLATPCRARRASRRRDEPARSAIERRGPRRRR